MTIQNIKHNKHKEHKEHKDYGILYLVSVYITTIVIILFILFILLLFLSLFPNLQPKNPQDNHKIVNHVLENGILPLHTFCISLKDRQDRRQLYLERMKDINEQEINIEIIDAIPKQSLLFSDFATNEMTSMTGGALGCTLSHLYVLLRFLSTTQPLILIMEDDAVCEKERFSNFLQNINHDFVNNQKDKSNSLSYRIMGEYDLLFLGVTHCQQNEETCSWFMNHHQENKDFNEIIDPKDVDYMWGTHAYLVTQRCANMLVSEILPLKKHYDMFLSDPSLWKRHGMKCGVVKNMICFPTNVTDSDTSSS
uniref:Glycosyl transferase family 25 domain-containing protein n=1 Tax=viral metagenome TaxID=1070528 RepID=A0A6C0D1W5_9ZZZZ